MIRIKNKRFLLAHLILLSTFPPLSTDMYLPALPTIGLEFASTVKYVNLSLILFFVFFGGSTLIWGTLSDKYGRRPMLLIGTGFYVLGGFLCAISANVYQFIIFRILQAIGTGAAVTISMAVMKDLFEEKERARILAYANLLFAIAPIIAPVLGAGILKFASWRFIFLLLGSFGAVSFVGCLLMIETTSKSGEKSLINTIGNLPRVLKNPGFTAPLLIFSLTSFPLMMWLNSASNIYIFRFKTSEQVFSFYFAGFALFTTMGPLVYLFLARLLNTYKIVFLSFFMTVLSGFFLIYLGERSPLLFGLAVLPAVFGANVIRPPSANILLEQGRNDAGAASSLMNFTFLFIGSIGGFLINLDWNSRIFTFGLINLILGLICLLFWPMVWKKCKA